MSYERDVPFAGPADAAWRSLSSLPPVRGSAAGYEGIAVVEDADDDARVATLRLSGTAGAATVAATATVTVLDGRVHVVADVHHGPGGLPVDEDTADDALGHLATTLAYALSTATRPRRAWDTAVAPTPATTSAWDTPSPPPPAPPSRTPIPADATLQATLARDPAEEPPAPAAGPPSESTAPVAGPPSESPPAAMPPAVIAPAPAPLVSTEVLTPRARDVVHPGQEPPPEEHRRPWLKAGVAAAAGLAVLRILRSRR